MSEPTCRWAGSESPRLLRSHLRDCEGVCDGCAPCQEGHCIQCGMRHVDRLTCPTCVGLVRTDLADIVAMSTRLMGEALASGVNSEAAMLTGPSADPETWARRHRLVVNAALGTDDTTSNAHRALVAWMEDCRDEKHPLWVLGSWDMLVTEHYGHDRTSRVTITDAAGYLGRNLTDLANDDDFAFDELAREVRQCRGHLEDVLHEGERDEKGAPCPTCRSDIERAPSLVKVHANDPTRDHWKCRRCTSTWTEAEYRLRIGTDYLAQAKELTAADIQRQYRVAPGTVRVWALRGKVAKRGRDESGRQLYDVPMVVATRDATPCAS